MIFRKLFGSVAGLDNKILGELKQLPEKEHRISHFSWGSKRTPYHTIKLTVCHIILPYLYLWERSPRWPPKWEIWALSLCLLHLMADTWTLLWAPCFTLESSPACSCPLALVFLLCPVGCSWQWNTPLGWVRCTPVIFLCRGQELRLAS